MTVHDVIHVGNRNICRLRMGQQGEEIISKEQLQEEDGVTVVTSIVLVELQAD